jgi:hypothetical protein
MACSLAFPRPLILPRLPFKKPGLPPPEAHIDEATKQQYEAEIAMAAA